MRYPVAAPDLGGNEAEYVAECLRSTWISSYGEFLARFERQVAEFVGVRHALAVSNGTVALHLAMAGLGLGPGDEVIVPALTFVATANAVVYCGAQPVMADCRADTWCLDVESVARLITPRTRAIVPVHLYGHPCEMGPLVELARRYRLAIVEDCAEALGAEYAGRRVGQFGSAATLSFFGNKIVTTGEGGMLLTDDDALAERCRLLRGQGMDAQRRYWHTAIGFNYRLTNLAAAVGVAQMERITSLLAARRRVAGWYDARLRHVPKITRPIELPHARHVCWMYTVLLPPDVDRDAVAAHLLREGIETRPVFYPLHTLPIYREARSDRSCPVACDIARRGLSLPTASYLRSADVAIIVDALAEALVVCTSRPSRKAA